LGLPQLRWWDAQAWTEHTSEARAPIVIQPATRLGFADDDLLDEEIPRWDELPSRREQRERERERADDDSASKYQFDTMLGYETDTVDEELSAQPLLAMTLKELEPPLTDTVDDGAPGPKRASSHTNAAPAASTLSALAEEEEAPARAPKRMRTYTGAIWTIALMPAIQLGISVALIMTGLGSNYPLYLVVWFAPYLIILGFAAFDRLLLTLWGHERPASAALALLTAPVYLGVRAVRTYRQTGKGLAPLAVFGASALSVLVGVLLLPGLIIAAVPAVFSDEVQTSVQEDAAALGATFTVECPAPPLIIGETFACIGSRADGMTDSISVRLTRQSGWIDWRVEDWGPSIMITN
jgi:hypothetical protein